MPVPNVRLIVALVAGLAAATALSNAARASVTYTYDNQGRVTTAQYSNGTKIVFSYDNAGNITTLQIACSQGGC